jgi:hypothetical protein
MIERTSASVVNIAPPPTCSASGGRSGPGRRYPALEQAAAETATVLSLI